MKKFLPALLAVIILGGCSSPQVSPQIYSTVAKSGASQAVVNRVEQGQVLGYSDILDLVEHNVPTQVVVDYLQSTQHPYNFSYSQLAQLKQAGATPQLLNFLTETQGFYGVNTTAQAQQAAVQQRQRDDAGVLAPFGYDPPMISTWYNSSYEESLYSPFSYN